MPVNFDALFRKDTETRDVEERRNALRLTLYAAIPLALLFSVLNYTEDHLWLASIQMAVALLLLMPSYLLSTSHRYLVLGEYLLMVSAVLIFGALFIDGGLSETGVYWIYIFPFLAFYIMGENRGWIWVSMFGIALLLSAGLHAFGGITLPYEQDRLRFFLAAFIFYVLIAAIFNTLRNNFEKRLMAQVHERTATAEAYLEELKHRMMHSQLTGLPNRGLLHDRLEQALCSAHRHHTALAVAVVNIDRLTEINNVLGHKAGDEVLKHVARALQASVRNIDTVAHIGADEFAIIMPTVSGDLIQIATRRLMSVFNAPMDVAGTSLEISGQIGFAIYPEHGADANELIQRADVAMRVAKKDQGQMKVYDSTLDLFNLRHLEMYRDLKRALSSDQLMLYYQPQIDLKSGMVVGVEALMRWDHADEGFISPAEFIPLAEKTGLITELSKWALRVAIAQAAQWQEEGKKIGVSVNMSVRCLMEPDMVEKISGLLSRYRLKCARLTIEVTESLFMERSDQVVDVLTRLREMGITISIDDFGTGYSSLSYLKTLPVDELKIDQAFIFPLATGSRQDRMIVHAIVQLGESLGFEVLAEGVENRESAEILKELGVHKVQGFHYARPMPADDFSRWLESSQNHAADAASKE